MSKTMIRLTAGDCWYVYGLYEEKSRPFYIGMAKNPVLRGAQHMSVAGYIRDRIRLAIQRGNAVSIGIIAEFAALDEARDYETYEIGQHQGLINKVGQGLWARRNLRGPVTFPRALLDEGAEK